MFLYAVFIILALAYLYPVSSWPTRAVNCESYTYTDIVQRERYCRDTYYDGSLLELISQLTNRNWTGAELRAGFEQVCSLKAPSALVNYVNCTSQIAHECPNLRSDVITAIQRRVDVFCNSSDVASWLLEALDMVKKLDAVCLGEVRSHHNSDCAGRAMKKLPSPVMNATLHSIMATSGEAFRQYYRCTKMSLMDRQFSTDSQCTNSWQEVSFGFALFTLGRMTVGFGLPEDVMTTILQDLQDIQDLRDLQILK